ncbi:Protein NUCLEAR FUSION DEFECTIVE 4 [Bienertia sinuspersici]
MLVCRPGRVEDPLMIGGRVKMGADTSWFRHRGGCMVIMQEPVRSVIKPPGRPIKVEQQDTIEIPSPEDLKISKIDYFVAKTALETGERRVCDVTADDADEIELQDVDNWVKDQDIDATGGKHATENIDVKSMMMRLNFWLVLPRFKDISFGLSSFCNDIFLVISCHLSSSMPTQGPALIVAAMVPMAAVFFLLMINESNLLLHASTPTIGFSTGITAALCVSTSELFGPKRFRVKYNIIVANVPLVLQYDLRHLGIPLFVGCFLALVLHFRTRTFYLQRL